MAERAKKDFTIMSNLIFETVCNIGVIKIDRPKALNALNKPIVEELDQIIDNVKSNSNIRVLVITGENNFAAGADIKGMVDCNVEEAKKLSYSKTFRKLEELDIVTIAAIEGYALGGGLELALSCDLRIASSTAKVGFPEINLGIMPGAGGTIRAPRLIGLSKAKELIFFGDTISGEKAEKFGLVNLAVEPGKAMETAMNWAQKLCDKAPIALKIAKETMVKGADESKINCAISIEEENWANLFDTEDQKEGMKAFIEKRKPQYNGR